MLTRLQSQRDSRKFSDFNLNFWNSLKYLGKTSKSLGAIQIVSDRFIVYLLAKRFVSFKIKNVGNPDF